MFLSVQSSLAETVRLSRPGSGETTFWLAGARPPKARSAMTLRWPVLSKHELSELGSFLPANVAGVTVTAVALAKVWPALGIGYFFALLQRGYRYGFPSSDKPMNARGRGHSCPRCAWCSGQARVPAPQRSQFGTNPTSIPRRLGRLQASASAE